MVTAYDATFARLVDATDVDIVLVGDSLGMVMQGREHTLEVTVDDVAYHSRCVRRALRYAHLCADMPFMSYQVSPESALHNAGRLVQEGGAASVKLEGGREMVPAITKIVAAGIPVMGHIGLTPQSVHAFGGFRVQGRDEAAAARLREDARRLAEAGCYAIVLEGIPAPLAAEITEASPVPTIGIGAGVGCDGQVLVMQDLLGLDDGFRPKFVKRYAEFAAPVRAAFDRFAQEVRSRTFPAPEHAFKPLEAAPAAADADSGSGDGTGYGPTG
jgi:3-methyl-2-oxobutanoate hydroxymethyltransferase